MKKIRKRPMQPGEPLDMSPKEYGYLHGVTGQTVRNWIKMGTVKATQPSGKNGCWSIPRG